MTHADLIAKLEAATEVDPELLLDAAEMLDCLDKCRLLINVRAHTDAALMLIPDDLRKTMEWTYVANSMYVRFPGRGHGSSPVIPHAIAAACLRAVDRALPVPPNMKEREDAVLS